MSEPIRSAPASPFAAARPQVHSRRVSVRLGSFGLTYSTDRVLWNPNPPPVDQAPAVDSRPARDAAQHGTAPAPQDLEAALRQARLWQAAQRQAAEERNRAQPQQADQSRAAEAASAQQAREAAAQGAGGSGFADRVNRVGVGQARGGGALASALRQASQAYLACAANFARTAPMLQAVA